MPNFFKMCLTLLIIVGLFKLGYRKGMEPNAVSQYAETKRDNSIDQHRNINPFASMPGKSNFLLNGVPAEVGMYTTNTSLAHEVTQFETKWTAKGCRTAKQTLGNAQILSVMNKNTKQFNLAIMMAEPGARQTFVIPATLDLSKPPAPAQYKTPIYPQAQPVMHLASNDLTGSSENVMLLSDAPVPQIVDYYKNQFISEGWQILDPPEKTFSSQFAGALFIVKNNDEFYLDARRMEGDSRTYIYTVYIDRL